MNMLIAVMGNQFSYVQANEETYRNKQIVELIIEHLDLINLNNLFKNKKYILILRPESKKIQTEIYKTSDVENILKN